mmetsp:Transcript_7365/g.19172  ORF Transcript_7365/g.19172 Transcript_7365/m.19172 type:complete len:252 (-) Transcript_7365:245-1000(-)
MAVLVAQPFGVCSQFPFPGAHRRLSLLDPRHARALLRRLGGTLLLQVRADRHALAVSSSAVSSSGGYIPTATAAAAAVAAATVISRRRRRSSGRHGRDGCGERSSPGRPRSSAGQRVESGHTCGEAPALLRGPIVRPGHLELNLSRCSCGGRRRDLWRGLLCDLGERSRTVTGRPSAAVGTRQGCGARRRSSNGLSQLCLHRAERRRTAEAAQGLLGSQLCRGSAQRQGRACPPAEPDAVGADRGPAARLA